ncbi:MAG: DUF896 domain-containing protein [Oscillospiraceae bacterium]|nr:DUF896 domain-containing protein [Oscillospiraceae bacterium]
MIAEKLNRINELAHLKRERALTADELAEQAALRQEYLAEWRAGAVQVLENTYIVDEHGVKRRLKPKQGRAQPHGRRS